MLKEQYKIITYANVLKIIACFAVVIIHVSTIHWVDINITKYQWNIMNLYDSLCRWSVPIFVMVTGMLLLSNEKRISISEIFTKYIKKIVIILIIWFVIFSLITILHNGNENISIEKTIIILFSGSYHLWYLYMLIGLYLITPLLKILTKQKNKKLIEYFLILWFVFECCLGMLVKIPIPIFNNILRMVYGNMQIRFVLGYAGYYLLGHYLHTYTLKKRIINIIYILAIVSFLTIIIGTSYLKMFEYDELLDLLYDFLSAPVCLTAIGVFILVKETFLNKNVSEQVENILQKWAKLSFGIYLIHPIFMILMKQFNISALNLGIEISIPLVSIMIYLLSIIISYILSQIPILGKYIVG